MNLRLITQWQCRNYNYTADRILEESSMPTYSPFGDLLHLATQFSYTIMFSVVWPFCCFCSFCRNAVALRFDAIKMTIDCKRPVPRHTVGIGSWLGAFMFEIALDAFFHDCEISEARYGPATACTSASNRLVAFCSLENVDIAICLIVYWKKSDISNEATIKIVAHSRRLRHNLRQSVRMISETILVRAQQSKALQQTWKSKPNRGGRLETATSASDLSENTDPTAMFAVDLDADDHQPTSSSSSSFHNRQRRRRGNGSIGGDRATGSSHALATQSQRYLVSLPENERLGGEWREGTVSWVKNGRIKVNFSGGRQLASGDGGMHHALTPTRRTCSWTPVKVFHVGMPVLLASKKFGCWLEATVTGLDDKDRVGNHVAHAPNEMHFRVVEAQNLRSLSARRHHATAIDPYCVVTVGTFFKHATSVKRRAVNPVWDEVVEFPLSERELYGGSTTETMTTTPPLTCTDSHGSSSINTSVRHAAPLIHPLERTGAAVPTTGTNTAKGNRGTTTGGGIGSTVLRTVKVSVFNNDPFALNECLGEVEIDLNQFCNGDKHRVLVPLSHKRHIWTLEAMESVMRRQALGAADYPVLGMPHLLLELQWVDTRLPTKVAVRVHGSQQPQELVLSRKFCETNLCYGIPMDAFGAMS
ncbi:Transmembrane protein, partial [Globisporangium splendens]